MTIRLQLELGLNILPNAPLKIGRKVIAKIEQYNPKTGTAIAFVIDERVKVKNTARKGIIRSLEVTVIPEEKKKEITI